MNYGVDDILNANDKLLNIIGGFILWLKVTNCAHTDSPPPLSIPTIYW